jgi:hypothetical protein
VNGRVGIATVSFTRTASLAGAKLTHYFDQVPRSVTRLRSCATVAFERGAETDRHMTVDNNGLSYDCDWRLGFNLDPLQKGTIGYVLFWSGCGGLSLGKDIEVWNPFAGTGQTVSSGATIKCVGLLESFQFTGDSDAPIRMTAYVSKDTAANVRAKLANPITATTLQVSWYIISYDDDRKQWFEAAFIKNGAKAQADVDITDGILQLFIDNNPVVVDARLDLRVFKFEFQVIPAEGSATLLEFATGATQRLVKNWAMD